MARSVNTGKKRAGRRGDLRKGYADAAFGQVHFRAAGEVGPWLFLLPQMSLSSRAYAGALPLLGRTARAVALDLPGSGETDAPRRPPSIPDYARLTVAAIDTFTRGRFALLGTAGGAAIAVAVASLLGTRVHRLVLLGTPFIPPATLREMARQHDGEPHIETDGSHFTRAWKRRQAAWPAASARVLHEAIVDIMRVYDHFNWAQQAMWRFNMAPHLRRIVSPTLFLSGEKDKLTGYNAAASALVKGSRHEVLSGVTEPLFSCGEEILARRIRGFLDKAG